MAIITFTSSMPSLRDTIQKHTVPDKDGFYKQLLGGFNVYNSSGDFYPYSKAVMMLFDASASLMRRLKNGSLKAEVGHPKREPGDTDETFAEKWLTIDPNNTCGIFRSVSVSDTPITVPNQPQQVYPTWGLIKPTGPKGNILETSLKDPDVNTAFSIRPVSRLTKTNGITIRNVIHIVTWDFVEEPGINYANKADTARIRDLTGENFEMPVTSEMVEYLKNAVKSNIDNLSGEAKENISEAIDVIEYCHGGRCVYKGW